jgi:hypothetical protein
METTEPTRLLRQVVADVLERFAFSFVEDEEQRGQETDWLLSDLTYAGPVQGRVTLALPRDLAFELGLNILGVDPASASAELAEDAVKELTNIICGELLYRLHGAQAVFNLGVPALRGAADYDAVEREIKPGAPAVRLSVEGRSVKAWLTDGT